MASNPPDQCCLVGVKHDGTPCGELETFKDIPAYFSHPKPENAKKDTAIVILTDVYGHNTKNPQLIADQFAANGYTVVMPDLFRTDPVPEQKPSDFSLQEWLKHHPTELVDPIVGATVSYLRSELGFSKIGGVGYCFGGKYLARNMADTIPADQRIDVGYTAHPSFVTDDELRGIRGPFSIAAAEVDDIFTVEKRHFTETELAKMGIPWQINLYSKVEHGFSTRGDVSKRPIRFAKEAAFEQAVCWFNEYL